MKTAYVKFFRDSAYCTKEYAYRTDIDLKEGDFAVVKVDVHIYNPLERLSRDTAGEYKVVKVVRVSDGVDEMATKYIVAKVDVSGYEKRLADEMRRAELLAKMERISERASKLKMYELLAETDENMKALLDEYNAIG